MTLLQIDAINRKLRVPSSLPFKGVKGYDNFSKLF